MAQGCSGTFPSAGSTIIGRGGVRGLAAPVAFGSGGKKSANAELVPGSMVLFHGCPAGASIMPPPPGSQ